MVERLKLANHQRGRMLLLDERSNLCRYVIIPHRAPAPTTRLESRGLSKGCQEKKLTSSRLVNGDGIPTLAGEVSCFAGGCSLRIYPYFRLTPPPQAFAFRLPIGSFSV